MDTIMSLLTTTEGRIGRQKWWIGAFTLMALAFLAGIVLTFVSQGQPTLMIWGTVALNLALIWPFYCIGIKRRHDRDNGGTDLKILMTGTLVLQLFQALRIGDILSGDPGPGPALWMQAIGFCWSVFGLYLFIQLGFLKGTTGANTYGPDPLDAAA